MLMPIAALLLSLLSATPSAQSRPSTGALGALTLRPFDLSTIRPSDELRVVPSPVEGRRAQGHPEQGRGVSKVEGRSLAPFVPTPMDVVERMLTLAKVGPRDVVYDLGCGDGRIVIAAAAKFGARGVGVDIDANLINQAEANAKAAGVKERVTFLVQDALTVDVSDATVVTLYLLSASNVKLRPILTKQLRRGARIVSHSFAIGDWEPDVVDTFRDAAGTSRTLYLWNFDGRYRP